MREIVISKKDAGQRFDKFLMKYLSKANSSFVYKMLRKKNIVLNDKKSDGKDLLNNGDHIKIYMAEDTIIKFSEGVKGTGSVIIADSRLLDQMPEIVYEDDNILLINKPVGMLSQKAADSDISANEICLNYLIHIGEVTQESLKAFKPSICNRLDRNTCGILIFAKNYATAKFMSLILKDRSAHKYYQCLVKGNIDKEIKLEGSLIKDRINNIVSVGKKVDSASEEIITFINPVNNNDKMSLVEVLLVTGKTHQIRAHLASIGHPIIGDYKYGDKVINDYYKKKYALSSQLLCAYKLEFPKIEEDYFEYLSEKVFQIQIPGIFKKVMRDGNLEI